MSKKNVAVFVSGAGTNLQAIIDANIAAANSAVVLSNKPDAFALDSAINHGIQVGVVDHKVPRSACSPRGRSMAGLRGSGKVAWGLRR